LCSVAEAVNKDEIGRFSAERSGYFFAGRLSPARNPLSLRYENKHPAG
jgi:hypothetical protein